MGCKNQKFGIVGLGIVGLGNIAQKAYLPILSIHPRIEVVGAFSPNTSKRDMICQTYRMTSFDTLNELASSIDAAFVHSSTETHYDIVSYLLEHGVDVYVDKPLAETIEEAEQLVIQAERLGRKLMVGFNRRFAPLYMRLQSESSVHMIDVVKHRENDVGPKDATFTLLDDYLHVIDTLRFLAGNELILVSGQSTSMTSMSCDSPVTYGKTSTECTRHRCIARPERTMSTSRSYGMGNDCPSKRWSRYIVSSTVDMKSKRSVHGTRHSCNEDSKARLTTSFPHSSRIQRF